MLIVSIDWETPENVENFQLRTEKEKVLGKLIGKSKIEFNAERVKKKKKLV